MVKYCAASVASRAALWYRQGRKEKKGGGVVVKYCAASVAFKCSTGYRQGREGMRRVVVKYYAASAVFKSSKSDLHLIC